MSYDEVNKEYNKVLNIFFEEERKLYKAYKEAKTSEEKEEKNIELVNFVKAATEALEKVIN